eukprot:Seg2026.2 transcript_id=Seg2026.2/GoldUCD/mRNA.D3Y31 product="Transmembrane protein 64" protein_id=Seg2026.2/GoldUCD/D3Y31
MSNLQVSHGSTLLEIENDDQVELLERGQKCFGEATEVERVLDSKCPCLRSKCFHFSWTFLVYAILAIGVVIFCRQYLKDFLHWLQQLDKWISGIVFVLMFTIVSFPMTWGYIMLNLAAGYLYGFIVGLVTVSLSVLFGVTISLTVCRRFIRSFVQSQLQSSHLKAMIQVIESRRGFKVVILTRLTPIPFGLQNGLFAITNISISRLALASMIGLLPTQALNSYIGSTLRTMNDVVNQDKSRGYAIIFIQVLISLCLMCYVIRRARYELNKVCLPPSKQLQPLKQTIRHSKSTSLNGFNFPSTALDNYDVNADLEELNDRKENKPGHKRAKSASAILVDLDVD